jgi:hypothetical protein
LLLLLARWVSQAGEAVIDEGCLVSERLQRDKAGCKRRLMMRGRRVYLAEASDGGGVS